MIATSHVIIGGAVGAGVGIVSKNPALALVAGIVSHLLCDMIPHLDAPFPVAHEEGHFDRPIWTKQLLLFAAIDSIFAFFFGLFIWSQYFKLDLLSPFAWSAVGAYLPDFWDNVPLWSKKIRELPGFKQFHAIHLATHDFWRFRFPMPDNWLLGIATQIILVLPCLWFILS